MKLSAPSNAPLLPQSFRLPPRCSPRGRSSTPVHKAVLCLTWGHNLGVRYRRSLLLISSRPIRCYLSGAMFAIMSQAIRPVSYLVLTSISILSSINPPISYMFNPRTEKPTSSPYYSFFPSFHPSLNLCSLHLYVPPTWLEHKHYLEGPSVLPPLQTALRQAPHDSFLSLWTCILPSTQTYLSIFPPSLYHYTT